ncbi:uncharacterized protein LOC144572217 [Carex rostrata]
MALDIANEHYNLSLKQGIQDKLMFTWATNGEFTVKRAYQMLFEFRPRTDISQSEAEKKLWTQIWKIQGTIPKIKLFIWKAIQGALPSASNLARRISKIEPTCGICGTDQEDAEHIIFHCPHARVTWFQSSLGLRTDAFEGLPIKEILTNLWSVLDQSQIALFLSIAWQVWKSRCSHLFDSKRVKPDNTLMAATSLDQAIKLTKLPCNMIPITVPSTLQGAIADSQQHCHVCYLDGSFNQPDKGGAAYLIHLDEELIRYEAIYKDDAVSPFQMEAFALVSAIKAAVQLGITCCIFKMDSLLLANTFRSGNRIQKVQPADWRAYTTLMETALILASNPKFSCVHIPREENHRANLLAKQARIYQVSYTGYTYPLCIEDPTLFSNYQ